MLPFLLLPILTKYLAPDEYGLLSIYLLLITIYTAFIGMAISTNISKNFFNVTKNEMSVYIGNMLIIVSLSFIFYLFLTFICVYFFDELFSIQSNLFLLIPFISFMSIIIGINVTLLRNELKVYSFAIYEISNTFLGLVITLFLLLYLNYNWLSQVWGIIASSLVFSFISIYHMHRRGYLKMKYDKSKIKSILSISVPLVPHALGSVIIAMSDRLFVEKMISLDMVGIYSVAYTFGIVIMIFTDAFIKAWTPWFFKNLSNVNDDKKTKIVKYTYLYIFGLFLLTIVISFISITILPYFIDPRFYEAKDFILWISLGYAVHGIYKIFFPYLVHLNKTSFLAVSTVLAAIVNLLFNYIFIKNFGAIGAAYATILSFLVSALLVFWYQSKNFYMPWFLIKK
jgi:O-antigen/teichoic acid export membrane protein